jgi:UDP-N-acetylglucosamine:LPS N-acetylglucosamine transferase
MNIFFILDDYLPNSEKVTPKMMHELACEYIDQGHQVSIITPDSSINTNVDILKLDEVKVYRFKSHKIKNVSKVTRAINETFLSYIAWKRLRGVLKREECDLIIYVSPSVFFGLLLLPIYEFYSLNQF